MSSNEPDNEIIINILLRILLDISRHNTPFNQYPSILPYLESGKKLENEIDGRFARREFRENINDGTTFTSDVVVEQCLKTRVFHQKIM